MTTVQTALTAAGLAAVAALVSARATGAVIPWLRRLAVIDHPNDRSSHVIPTPRGGGWGVLMTMAPAWIAIGWLNGALAQLAPTLAGLALVAAVSWRDDRHGLSARVRFLAQIGAVALGLLSLPGESLVFQGLLPWGADRCAAGFCWLWFLNLSNFMDGIDGLAGGQAVANGLGVAVVALTVPGLAAPGLTPDAGAELAWRAAALAGAATGFLVWNWRPAKVFLGDVGSVPLGFALGSLLLTLAAAGAWVAALLLPLYFLTDATFTLLKRLVEGKKIWQAHREHFYQRAVQRGFNHAQVSAAVAVANLGLIALAVAAPTLGWLAPPAGAAVIALLLAHLLAGRPPRSRPPCSRMDSTA